MIEPQGFARIWLWNMKLQGRMCEPVTDFGDDLKALIDQMFATLTLHEGIGLAAPQIGVFKRVAIVHLPRTYEEPWMVIVNPSVIEGIGKSKVTEGCLSLPGEGINARVQRFASVIVSYQDMQGETCKDSLDGLEALVFQHEADHLNGMFFTNHLSRFQRSRIFHNHKRSIAKRMPEDLVKYYVTEWEQERIDEQRKRSETAIGSSATGG